MKFLLFLIIFILSFNLNLVAQTGCMQQEIQVIQNSENSVPCFDVDYVKENCVPIYLRMNIHFYLNDNCDGNINMGDAEETLHKKGEAFEIAENYVDELNNFYEVMSTNGQHLFGNSSHGLEDAIGSCVPIRYVLDDVIFHCDESAFESPRYWINSEIPDDIENGSSVVNVFFTNWPSLGEDSGGIAWDGKNIAVNNTASSLAVHELGHAIGGLKHPQHGGSGQCNDTWNTRVTWDSDGDGQVDEILSNGCWVSLEEGNDLCNEEEYVNVHPCCGWDNQSNNPMAYSGYGNDPNSAAFSNCQIETMLKELAENECERIISIGNPEGCAPPSAIINTLPTVGKEMDCEACLHFEASDNEYSFEFTIKDGEGNIIVDVSEIESEAGTFCIPVETDKFGNTNWDSGFESGVEYEIVLKVYNRCHEMDMETMKFILPEPCSKVTEPKDPKTPIRLRNIYPNPLTHNLNVEIFSEVGTRISIFRGQMNTSGAQSLLLGEYDLLERETRVLNFSTNSWESGYHSIVIIQDGNILQFKVLKL